MVCGLGRLYLHWASGHDAPDTHEPALPASAIRVVQFRCGSS
jgi:hypothetical protein